MSANKSLDLLGKQIITKIHRTLKQNLISSLLYTLILDITIHTNIFKVEKAKKRTEIK